MTALIHYEVLSALNHRLPALHMPSRSKLLVVIFTTFVAHAIEIVVYAVALYLLGGIAEVGHLKGEPDYVADQRDLLFRRNIHLARLRRRDAGQARCDCWWVSRR